MNALPFPLDFVKSEHFVMFASDTYFFKEIKQHARHNENSFSRGASSLLLEGNHSPELRVWPLHANFRL